MLLHNLADLRLRLEAGNDKVMLAARLALGEAAKLVQQDAKDRIGEYQDASGPFSAWEPLAEDTEAEKARLGYPQDAPLLRDGDLRDSIVTEQSGNEAVVGSPDPVAAWQEFGTVNIPPRPFLGPAAFSNREEIRELIGEAVTGALAGKTPPE